MTKSAISRRRFIAAAAGTLLSKASFGASPLTGSGPIMLVVPFAAGGATDIVSRLIARKLSGQISRSVVVENAAGGGGVIGSARVARAPRDGLTLLMGTVATHAIYPLAASPAPYDPEKDFTPVSLIATVPNVLLVSKDIKARDVEELIKTLRAKPGAFSYGSSGVGTPPHLSGELFKSLAGVKMDHVPYRGGAPAMVDLVAGHIPILFDVLTGAASHIRSGAARALAVTTAMRSPSFPDIPTMSESGLPGYETYTWNAVFGPAGLPRNVVEFLSGELQKVVADPEVQEKLKDISANAVGSPPEALAVQVKAELNKWKPIIESIGGLKLQ